MNKIIEKLLFSLLYKFLDDFECIYSLQFGFRAKHSTNHALIDITENIRYALNNKKVACGIFVDLQKAFDTANHNILLYKLYHYGIRGIANTDLSCLPGNPGDSRFQPVSPGLPGKRLFSPGFPPGQIYIHFMP